MESNDLIIGGIAVTPILVIVGQWLKSVGVVTKWIPPINVVLGILVSVAWTAVHLPAAPEQWFISALMGVYMGLASSGLYIGQQELRSP